MSDTALGKDILISAVHLEYQTRSFYVDFAKKVKNSQAIKKMVQLAKEENRHAQLLKRRLKKLYKKDFVEEEGAPQREPKFLIAETAIHDKADVLEIVSIGILLENGSIKHYEELLEQALDKEDIKLLSDLVQFEIQHKKTLQREYNRIAKVSSFFETGIKTDNITDFRP